MKLPKYTKKKHWEPSHEELVEKFVDIFREAIIANSEEYANHENETGPVRDYHVQFGMVKAIATLNCTNRLSLLERYGPDISAAMIIATEQDAVAQSIDSFKKAIKILGEIMERPSGEDNEHL